MRTLIMMLVLTFSGCALSDRAYIRWVESNRPEWTEQETDHGRHNP
jgi:hypothetical protein